jgi:tetratricopeptide (TPR) repeat protein
MKIELILIMVLMLTPLGLASSGSATLNNAVAENISLTNESDSETKELGYDGSTPDTTTISPDAARGAYILDNSMASSIDESTNSVITRTYKFYRTDSKAYSWLELGNVRAGTVLWEWYSPDGNLYKTGSVDISPSPSGGNWPSYYIWYYIDIAGDMPANLPGDWHVDIYLDGQKLLTEHFNLEANAIQPNPDNADAWNEKGIALADMGKYDEAILAFNESIRLDPNRADSWYSKGVALYDMGKYDDSLKAYEEAIRLNPNHADAWYNKGIDLGIQGKYDEAIQAFDKAIDINPQDADAWYYKGLALDDQGRYDEAIKAFNESIRLDPNDADAWYYKGIVLGIQGRYDEAIQAFDKAIDINPQDADAWYYKGVALDNQGKSVEASMAYNKSIDLDMP